MEESKYEECGFVNHGGRICYSIQSGERNQVSVSTSDVHGSSITDQNQSQQHGCNLVSQQLQCVQKNQAH